MTTTNSRTNSLYRNYCQALANLEPALQGEALREYIRQEVRASYVQLFQDSSIRQRDMTPAQLELLSNYRRITIESITNA
jgi:hypothetical protein